MPTPRREHSPGFTSDSNGYPYCTGCGQAPSAHTDTRRVLLCPCRHMDVSRPTQAHPFYHCNVCDTDLTD